MIKKAQSDAKIVKRADEVDFKVFHSQTEYAQPLIQKKLIKQLGFRKRKEINKEGKVIEKMAQNGD